MLKRTLVLLLWSVMVLVPGMVVLGEEEDAGTLTPYNFPDSGDDLVLLKGNYDSDPAEELFIGNRFIKMVIEPSAGGVIGGFRYHGLSLTQPQNPATLGGGGGFFADHANTTGGRGDWWQMPYTYKIIEQTPEQISVELSRTGFTGSKMFLTFNKTYTVWRDRSYVQVDYDIKVAKQATTSLPFRFLFLNWIGTRDDAMNKSRDSIMFVPERKGLTRYDFYGPGGHYEEYFYNPSRGWTGFADTKLKKGIIFGMDFRYVDYMYGWGSTGHNGFPTWEWRFNQVTIKDGESFKTTMYAMPIQGFDDVAGGGGYVVGNMICSEKGVSAKIISGRDQKAQAILRYRVMPSEEWKVIGTKDLDLVVDEPMDFTLDLDTTQQGTYVVSMLVMDGETELLEMERSLVVGESTGQYGMRPRQEKIIEETAKIETSYKSMSFETPHVKWGKPYAGGKTKAIILMDGRYQREVIEVAQRMDLDFDTTYLWPTYIGEAIVDYYGRTSGGDLQLGLVRLLKENPDWEVMVIAGNMLGYMDVDQTAAIMKQISEGAGLVVVQPEPMFSIKALSPLQKDKDEMISETWQKKVEHFITTGIPFKALPATEGYIYKPTPDAQVLATMGGHPLLAVRNHGKGRVVAMAYRSGDRRTPKDFFGLTPYMTRERNAHQIGPKPPWFGYHEYHFSMLGKALLWAAGKEPALQIESITVDSEKVSLKVNNTGEGIVVSMDGVFQDKYGNSEGKSFAKNVDVPKGKSTLTLEVPGDFRNGFNIADVFLRDHLGKIITWGSAMVDIEHPVTLAKLEGLKKVYNPGDKVEVAVTANGQKQEGLSVTARVYDGFKRLLDSQTKAISVGEEVKFALSLERTDNRFLAIEAELFSSDGRSIDIAGQHRPLEQGYKIKAKSGDPIFIGWIYVTVYGANNYLHKSLVDLMAKIGFNGVVIDGRENTPSFIESVWGRNMVIEMRSGGLGHGRDVSDDPEHPIRDNCLNDPKVRKTCSGQIRGGVGFPNSFSFQFGDESLYAIEGADYCFCKYCMPIMQEWLKKRYSDVDKLNAVWGSKFASWDQVQPMTLKETKARGDENYASWSDHRRFNEYTVAGFYSLLSDAAQMDKPWGRFGMSGDFGPGSYSGQNNWRWRNCFTQIEAYNCYDELDAWRDVSEKDIEIRKYGNFGDYDTQRESLNYFMFNGVNGMAVCGPHRLPNFDWTLSGAGRGYMDSWRPIKRGLGRILMESKHVRQPIALHYTRNDSARVAYLRGLEPMWGEMRWNGREMGLSNGFDLDWISYEQIENGIPDKYKTIVMLMSMSISEKEAESLEAFVDRGGVLLGIMGIGVADSNCNPLEKGALDHVFGISRDDSKIVIRKGAIERGDVSDGLVFPDITTNKVEIGVKADGAKVLAVTKEDKLPIAFANKFGKGLAVYMACDLPAAYAEIQASRNRGNNAEVMDETIKFVNDLYGKGGVGPILDITDAAGKRIPYMRIVNYQDGPVQHFGLLRLYGRAKANSKKPIEATIKFPTKGYIYEYFTGNYLGHIDSVRTTLTPTALQFYTILPYEVEAVKLKLSSDTLSGGDPLVYSIKIAAKGDGEVGNHIFRMNVMGPDHKEYEPYSCNITSKAGVYSETIPLALNERKGVWTIVVTDLFSGKKAASQFTVK